MRIAVLSYHSLPHWGRLCPSILFFSTYPVFALTMREKRYSRFAAFPIGEGFVRRYCFPTYACICSDNARKATSSYRSLPHWGRGTAPAVDRVLSLIVDLRCIFSLSFIPLEPYPARYARHLPHAGKAGDTRETCHPQTFGYRPIYICGEAATTNLNPEPFTPFTFYLQSKPYLYSTYSFFFTSIL